MNTIMICGARVIASKGQDVVQFGKTDKGSGTATFRIAEEIYDPKYPNKKRYNNFFVEAHGFMADRITKMKLANGSYVNITCKLDFSTSILERQECSVNKEDPNYGYMRYARGLKMELIDISYASYYSSTDNSKESVKEENEEKKTEVQEKEDVRVINLDKNNILMRQSRRVFSDNE